MSLTTASTQSEKTTPLSTHQTLDSSDDGSLFSLQKPLQAHNLYSRLHIKMDDWLWRHATVLGADKETQLFKAETHMRSPHLRLRNLSSPSASVPESTQDTATMHTFKCDIDLLLQGQALQLKSRGAFKDGWTYDSPALAEKLIWRSERKWDCFTLVCLDQQGTVLARSSLRKFSMKTAGAVEILSAEVLKDAGAVHEFVLCGLAVMQFRILYLGATGYGYYVAAASSALSKAGSSGKKKNAGAISGDEGTVGGGKSGD